MFYLQSLEIPIIAAPMAGGVSTPELVGAVGAAGGLGFVAGGYLSPEALAAEIELAHSTGVPFGVNIFIPDDAPSADALARLDDYRAKLTDFAGRYDVAPGEPRIDEDHYAAKLDVLAQSPVPVVSFTFGCPSKEEVEALHEVETFVLVTVTAVDEARAAARAGADALVVQGPEAGGHRGTFSATTQSPTEPLPQLIREVIDAVDLPVVAAGGLASGPALRAALDAGAVACQLGTAFLLADEAGTPEAFRRALQDPQFIETRLTRAFTGRPARALENDAVRALRDAPPAYPQVHAMTLPVRLAAAKALDPQGMALWAGTTWRDAQPGPAAEIVARLWAAAQEARA